MSARMYKCNIALCIALLFCAACENDPSGSTAVEINAQDKVSCSSEVVLESSSSSKAQEISSSSKIQEDSTSSGVSSSSISPTDISSSSKEYPYTLRDDPSVHCKDSIYYAEASCSSFRPEPQMDKPNPQAAPPPSGEGPFRCWEYPVPAFACDNGWVYSKGNDCYLVGDTIVQRYVVSAEEVCARNIEEAEASTEYPYRWRWIRGTCG